jgi:hypothetical protein
MWHVVNNTDKAATIRIKDWKDKETTRDVDVATFKRSGVWPWGGNEDETQPVGGGLTNLPRVTVLVARVYYQGLHGRKVVTYKIELKTPGKSTDHDPGLEIVDPVR